MNLRTEQELLNGARTYDAQTLAEVYDRYSPGLYAYALRLLGDECLAEDCVAETFSRFLKSLRGDHGPHEHLQAYLYRIAHNWITDQYRRQPPPAFELDENLRAEDEIRLEDQLAHRLEQERVRTALRMLTPDQRQVVILRFLEGWENEDVADAIQKPIGAVRALQHRALATLRRWLLRKEEGDTHAVELGN
jgi:RNA polymerase sigma-70 factor (ECF subfamily)